jgi:hypothetical protein
MYDIVLSSHSRSCSLLIFVCLVLLVSADE